MPTLPGMAIVPDANLNALWCRAIAEELMRGGITSAVLCPGSRNSPLLQALYDQLGAANCISHVDERSAGFIALGMARVCHRPVALCVTSGSAVANLLPAITEAQASGIPLVVISADRPWEAHGCASPQTMPQVGLFSPFISQTLAVGEPINLDPPLRSLRARLSWLIRTAVLYGQPQHVNVPLRDPLSPAVDTAFSQAHLSSEARLGRPGHPYITIVDPCRATAAAPGFQDQLDYLAHQLPSAPRGLIVVGPASSLDAQAVRRLIDATGFPIIADVPGDLRNALTDQVMICADALLGGVLGQSSPELIIQLGPAPLARSTFEFLERQRCAWLVIARDARNCDFLHHATACLIAPRDSELLALVNRVGRAPAAWQHQWRDSERQARATLLKAISEEPWGEVLAAHRAVNHPGFPLLHVASSMAVRHANLHCLPTDQDHLVTANRGVNGIDGTIGTFLGELLGGDRAGLLLIGDLAFLHDLPALASTPLVRRSGAIVLLNNDGGGIFDFLSVAQMPAFQQLVRTRHGMHFAHIAAQFGMPYTCVDDDMRLGMALDRAAQHGGISLIECRVGGDTVARHRALVRLMANAPVSGPPTARSG